MQSTERDATTPRGVFVTFEGVDGAGKTTQCSLLCAALAADREVVRLREPGGTAVGERVRSILLDPALAGGVDPVCELLLYEAARAQLVGEIVRPALERAAAVVSDRFLDSTTAYQGLGRGIADADIAAANALACRGLMPDRTILLDLPPACALKRAVSGGADRMELEGTGFQERVRAGFLAAARLNPKRMRVVDASGDVESVWRRVRDALADLFDLPQVPPSIRATCKDARG